MQGIFWSWALRILAPAFPGLLSSLFGQASPANCLLPPVISCVPTHFNLLWPIIAPGCPANVARSAVIVSPLSTFAAASRIIILRLPTIILPLPMIVPNAGINTGVLPMIVLHAPAMIASRPILIPRVPTTIPPTPPITIKPAPVITPPAVNTALRGTSPLGRAARQHRSRMPQCQTFRLMPNPEKLVFRPSKPNTTAVRRETVPDDFQRPLRPVALSPLPAPVKILFIPRI